MASYRPKIKIDSAGNTKDLPLDAETLQGKNVDYFATKTEVGLIQEGNVNALKNKLGKTETAVKANGVTDYGDRNKTIDIGFAGTGASTADYFAVYQDSGAKIKNMNVTNVKNVLGINNLATKSEVSTADAKAQQAINQINSVNQTVSGKQDELVSGTNIKTINGQSLLGSGNLTIETNSNIVPKLVWSGKQTSVYTPLEGDRFYLVYYTIPNRASSEQQQLVYIKSEETKTNVVFYGGSNIIVFTQFSHDKTHISVTNTTTLKEKQSNVSLGFDYQDEVFITKIYQVS